nr:MAG TPA: Regulatory protein-modification, helix-turn-helix, transcriptional regulator, DNA [Caudoviricetes sp.]
MPLWHLDMTMSNSQVVITRAVLQHMAHEGLSQSQMGKLIGMRQPVLSRKLTGSRRWIIDDVDRLIDAGVPVSIPATDLLDGARP